MVSQEAGNLSGSAVALDALADVDMLASCGMLVVVMRSAISRLAFSLSIARKGRVPPTLSLQWPWGDSWVRNRRSMKLPAGSRRLPPAKG